MILANLPYVRTSELDELPSRRVSPRSSRARIRWRTRWTGGHRPPARPAAGGSRKAASRCSRSARTRARPSRSARTPPGWACEVVPDLADRRGSRLDGGRLMLVTAAPSLMPASMPATPEPAFPIRLIALDIDGTIIGDDHEVGARTIAAVRGGDGPRRRGVAGDGTDGLVGDALRRALGPDGSGRGLPGRPHPRHAAAGLAAPGQAADAHAAARRGCPPRSFRGRASTASIRTSTTSSGSSSAPTIRRPTTTPRSWALVPSSFPTSLEAIDHPVTKILAVGEPPVPIEVAPDARAEFGGWPM